MTPQFVQIAIGLIGALLGIAVTWGSQRRTIDQLTEAVKELTKKIELIAALEKADALHAQEADGRAMILGTDTSQRIGPVGMRRETP